MYKAIADENFRKRYNVVDAETGKVVSMRTRYFKSRKRAENLAAKLRTVKCCSTCRQETRPDGRQQRVHSKNCSWYAAINRARKADKSTTRLYVAEDVLKVYNDLCAEYVGDVMLEVVESAVDDLVRSGAATRLWAEATATAPRQLVIVMPEDEFRKLGYTLAAEDGDSFALEMLKD